MTTAAVFQVDGNAGPNIIAMFAVLQLFKHAKNVDNIYVLTNGKNQLLHKFKEKFDLDKL